MIEQAGLVVEDGQASVQDTVAWLQFQLSATLAQQGSSGGRGSNASPVIVVIVVIVHCSLSSI
jgi:hypothetical protein